MKHWKSVLALLVLPFAFYTNFVEFYFAILFLIWSIQGLKSKKVSLLEEIDREDNPILYWSVTVTWFVLSLFALFYSEPFFLFFTS